jgi:hypothetical protein
MIREKRAERKARKEFRKGERPSKVFYCKGEGQLWEATDGKRYAEYV